MRKISKWQVFVIFYYSPPRAVAEWCLIVGVSIPILTYPITEGLFPLLLLVVSGIVVFIKLKAVRKIKYIIKNGIKTEAEITRISNTVMEVNDRTLKTFNFQYVANGKRFNHEYQSAYKGFLKHGDRLTLIFLEENPRIVFIPRLYKLRI